VGRETVPQRAHANALGDAGRVRCLDDDTMELSCADRSQCVLTRKEPAVRAHDTLLPSDSPPRPQQLEQAGGQHGVAIPSAFATLDLEQHALAVDVAHLER
jgi:hypothetical protein